MPGPAEGERQRPLWTSYCANVIRGGAALVVRDAETNPIVCTIGAWRDGFVSYLGVPIRDEHGVVIAALSVADGKPRTWTRGESIIQQHSSAW